MDILLGTLKNNPSYLQSVNPLGMSKPEYRQCCLTAIKLMAESIQFIDIDDKDEYYEICKLAIEADDGTIQPHLINKELLGDENYKDIAMKIIIKNEDMVPFIHGFDEQLEFYELALSHNGMIIKHLINPTSDLCLIAVKNNGLALLYVANQTPEICLAAINNNPWAIQFCIKDRRLDLLLLAVKKDKKVLDTIKDTISVYHYIEILMKAFGDLCDKHSELEEKVDAYEYVKNGGNLFIEI